MKLLLTDFTEEELRYCIDKAYDGKFDTEAIAPLAEVKNAWYLELFHGPTIALRICTFDSAVPDRRLRRRKIRSK